MSVGLLCLWVVGSLWQRDVVGPPSLARFMAMRCAVVGALVARKVIGRSLEFWRRDVVETASRRYWSDSEVSECLSACELPSRLVLVEKQN